MPTSKDEAQAIVDIVGEYLRSHKAKELCARLDSEVGSLTDNSSLRDSLSMLHGLYENVSPPRSRFLDCLLGVVVVVHSLVIMTNIVAFFVLPFLYSLWVWVPLNSFILTVTFTREICPLTRLENRIRVALDKPRIGGFIGHYFIRPVRSRLEDWKACHGSEA